MRYIETEEENPENNEQSEHENDNIVDNKLDKHEDSWSEVDDAELISGEADTMLSPGDFIETNESDFVYNFALGERNIPVSVFLGKD
jgi:hypothetical protein